ncbi:cupin domain-containing protein [Pseudooceanicola marinus]|uniref:cupin domain-containing protein n=1 Tax=Pseudooceanicola marinus TaxID=396013 RepID=UPI0022863264|nr:cupin domain-containing protein [Pseudooceanicola marinus]
MSPSSPVTVPPGTPNPAGQTILITYGRGWVQREGGPIEEISKGDVVFFPAGEKHWHGATPENAMNHIAIQDSTDGSPVTWMQKGHRRRVWRLSAPGRASGSRRLPAGSGAS